MFQTFSLNHVWYLVQASGWTLVLSVIALIGGGLGGGLVALMRVSMFAPLRGLAAAYIYAIQGTPLLVLLFIAYFGLSYLGLELPAIVAAALGLTLYASAFLGEIWRGVIQAVARGQWEGAEALALSWPQTMRLVIIPQALRSAIPPTIGFSVQVVKNTALASIVGFIELTRAGQIVASATFQPLQVYLTVGAIYFVICSALSYLSRVVDRRVSANAA
jgi:polar amino acid transport system permease protein